MEKGRAKRRPGRYVDTRTRYQGVYARHRISCALACGGGCCSPTRSKLASPRRR